LRRLARRAAAGRAAPRRAAPGRHHAIRAIIAGKTRTVLTGHLNLYVATTGNDANPGTLAAPFLTIQGAINYIYRELDLNGAWGVYINVVAGTYTGAVVIMGRPVGAPSWWAAPITITGDVVTPANVHLTVSENYTNLFVVANGAGVHLQGLKLTHTGTPAGLPNLVFAANAGWVYISDLELGATPAAHLYAHQGRIETVANDPARTSAKPYKIIGGANYHMVSQDGGYIVTGASTVTLVGTPAFAYSFVYSETAGRVWAPNITFIGAATGSRFISNPGGFIHVNGAGANYFPGSIAGTTHALGFYV
jgi:hypothetical protein